MRPIGDLIRAERDLDNAEDLARSAELTGEERQEADDGVQEAKQKLNDAWRRLLAGPVSEEELINDPLAKKGVRRKLKKDLNSAAKKRSKEQVDSERKATAKK